MSAARVTLRGADGRALPSAAPGPSRVAIGNFDGVHRGHASLVAALGGPEEPGRRLALTFDPHPAEVLGRAAPPRLTSLPRRSALLARAGVDAVAVCAFTRELASLDPEAFVREVLVAALGARRVVVGPDFHFGRGRAGDGASLVALGAGLGFEVVLAPAVGDADGAYSSSRVRAALAAGEVDAARRVLGRPHAFVGTVVTGDRLGRTLGFPTANLDALEELAPGHGVYAVRVERLDDDGRAEGLVLGRGVMNVGVRPTVSGALARRVEVHLLDGGGELYGATLRVHLVAKLRDERRFDGLDALKAQIARDVEGARAALAGDAPSPGVVYDRDDAATSLAAGPPGALS